MEWVIALLAVGVLGAAAVAAAGGLGGMEAEPVRDDFEPTFGPTAITGEELRRARFSIRVRGYDMRAVDDLLDRLGREIDARDAQLDELRTRRTLRPPR